MNEEQIEIIQAVYFELFEINTENSREIIKWLIDKFPDINFIG